MSVFAHFPLKILSIKKKISTCIPIYISFKKVAAQCQKRLCVNSLNINNSFLRF